MSKRILSLSEFIEDMGDEDFAEQFETSVRAARSYRYGERSPDPKSDLVKKLVKQPHLTWESIYGS